MAEIIYDPTQYEVAVGWYETELFEIKDEPPFKDSKFGTGTNEPRLSWHFRINGPQGNPNVGKVLRQGTGTIPTRRSGLVRLLTLLLGRPPQDKERIDPAHFVGRRYEIFWSTNPKSEQGRPHVESLKPLGPALGNSNASSAPPAGGPAAPPTPPPSRPETPRPPPPPPPGPKPSPTALYWTQLSDESEPKQRSGADVQKYLDMARTPEEAETLISVHDPADQLWKSATKAGWKASIPF